MYQPATITARPNSPTADDILAPGASCWRVERAARAAVLIDADAYFRQLDLALRSAQHSIWIIGWDFDGRIRLLPDASGSPALGDLLRSLVETRPDLTVRILIWSVAVVHAPGASLPLLVGTSWEDHPRIQVKLDTEHPIYASHHQKIVVIDDELAFCGGIDLTVQRWDTEAHREDDLHRRDPDGDCYQPVHDVQAMVQGGAARALAQIAAGRWRRATGERVVMAERPRRMGDAWPESCPPLFRDVDVGISRTMPAWRTEPPIEEIAALTERLLLTARRSIYIESQYFSGQLLRRVMERILASPSGPEVLVVAGCQELGVVERWIMGNNRNRLIRRLRSADRFNRLRVLHPVVRGRDGPCDVLVHSKLMIIDDEYLRIGSANLNNRSLGVDTECDLVIRADDARTRKAIASLRSRLLAEHLGAEAEAVAAVVEDQGLIAATSHFDGHARGLKEFSGANRPGPSSAVFGTSIFDPPRPLEPLWFRRKRQRSRAAATKSQHQFVRRKQSEA